MLSKGHLISIDFASVVYRNVEPEGFAFSGKVQDFASPRWEPDKSRRRRETIAISAYCDPCVPKKNALGIG
jgi:hypothetical protein